MLSFSDMSYILVRYVLEVCLMLTSSCLVELLFLLCFIAAWTCVVVSVILVVCSLCISYLCVCLFYVLNVFVICVGEVNVFTFKINGLFISCGLSAWRIMYHVCEDGVCRMFIWW